MLNHQCLIFRSRSSVSNELIVVTILVAAEGGVKLPKVTSLEELRSALNTLGGISESQVTFIILLASWSFYSLFFACKASGLSSGNKASLYHS